VPMIANELELLAHLSHRLAHGGRIARIHTCASNGVSSRACASAARHRLSFSGRFLVGITTLTFSIIDTRWKCYASSRMTAKACSRERFCRPLLSKRAVCPRLTTQSATPAFKAARTAS
jgi:hypothetical protein